MQARPLLVPLGVAVRRAAALAAAVAITTGPAWAQQAQPAPPAGPPITSTSADALVAALAGGPATRSFRRTALPDVGSSLCSGQQPTAQPGKAARNLEVVPYAGDTTPGVNLSVQFAHGSDQLTRADTALLDTLAAALQSPTLLRDSFAIAGHTDGSGDARVNLELSCARALAVRRHLATRGVALQRVSAYGFGSTRLLVADQPGDAGNRRVEVRKAPD